MNPSDPIGRSGKAGAIFARLTPRVFQKKDDIPLLRAVLEFSSLKKTLVVYDKDDEYEFVRQRLDCSPSKQQFVSKCSHLKLLYRSKLSEGAAAGGLTGDDAVIFELSEKLWGEEVMMQLKEKERERSARAGRSGQLRAGLGLEDVKDGSDEGEGDVLAKSEGQSLGMVSGKGGKRKREDEPGKIGGMAKNVSGDEVLDDGDGEIVGSDKSSAKSGWEDGESAWKASWKEKKHQGVENGKLAKVEDSRAKSGSEDGESARKVLRKKEKTHKGVENGKLAKVEDSRAKSGSEDGESAQKVLRKKEKTHKGVENGKLAKAEDSRTKSGSEDGESGRKVLRKKEKKHRGVENGKLAKAEASRAKSGSEDGESARKVLRKKEKKHKGVENGKLAKVEDSRAQSGLVDGISACYGSRKEKKHKHRELDNFSEKESGMKDDGPVGSPADSQLDKGEKSSKNKKHKGDEAGEFKRLWEGGKLGGASSQLEGRKSVKKKKHKGDRS